MSARSLGPWFALPVALFLLLAFATPLIIVAWYSPMPPRTFGLTGNLTLANYRGALTQSDARPLKWSIFGAVITTLVSTLLAWPAIILHRHAGRWAPRVSGLIALPIFFSESARLFGLNGFLMPRGGILAGSLEAALGLRIGLILNTPHHRQAGHLGPVRVIP